jgi:hypothetical protein
MAEGDFTVSVPTSPAPAPAAAAPPAAGSATPDFMSFVPAEYKDAQFVQEHAKSDKPIDNFFKSYVNAQELIGKQSAGLQVPTAESTPEQIANWNKALGVPDKSDGYEYTAPDLAAESDAVKTVIGSLNKDGAFLNKMREAALSAGLTPKQFSALIAGYDAHTIEQVKGIVANNETARSNFVNEQNAKVKGIYGDKGDSMHAIAKYIAQKVLPESVRNTGDPEICLLAALNYIHEQQFKNDSVVRQTGAAGNPGGDVRSEIVNTRKAMRELKNGFQNPEYDALNVKLQALYRAEQDIKVGANK